MVPIEAVCEHCGETYTIGCVTLHLELLCDPCREKDLERRTKVWLSNGKDLLGPIQCRTVKKHPNLSATFQVTDPDWLVRLGWGPSAYVEIQAYVLVPGVRTPRDTYWWNYSLV